MEEKGKILIVDDNEDVLFALNLLLEPYMEKIKVTTQPNRIKHFMETFHPDIILLDMNFCRDAISGNEGFEYLEQILQTDPKAVVVFMTAYADTEKVVRAIKAGATDFISKPWEKEKLIATLSSAIKLSRSRKEVNRLQEQILALKNDSSIPDFIGESLSISKLKDTIYKLSDTDANILILGENGTGKDLVARIIKHLSPRSNEAFVTIDLGSIPEQLFESELFGYEKGAFTDAKKSKPGRMEMASGGTLFLDEIGNLSMQMQSKLLTAIEKRYITRLGGVEHTNIDVRLISATNSNLHDMIENGTFRQDLLYRINTIELHIPPLRERGNDIILLAEHFLKIYDKKYKKEITGINREAKNKLLKYQWPGNVRELQHVIERAVIMSENSLIRSEDFMFSKPDNDRKIIQEEELNLETLEKNAIEKAIKLSKGNYTMAAEMLGISRFSLYRKIDKLKL
ncbi:MAG: sigma-54 dependent transcriptional regulator [Phocaeicola sp.]|nr:sigma-54 dependent transcriptional regulator [Phocaeicola sp.]